MSEEEEKATPKTFFELYKWPIVLGAVSIFFIISALVLLFKTTQTNEPIIFSSTQADSSQSGRLVVVDIEGAIEKPGLYELAEGSRVEELLQKAGGLSQDADSVWVGKTLNRAALLQDGGKLFIPTKGDASVLESAKKESVVGAVSLISINSASAKELDTLPGVGEVTSQKIISGRPYQTIEELLSRKIVGQSAFEKIKGQITL
ncbi:ComEA family DNA-binding protein [Patescibacteria group bacterium]|nr:ComEA family DNA-binding protein [Patescibacteria group bacterium]